MEAATTPKKTMRADARRNREKLMAAALATFSEEGTDVSLETIARSAGVGVGTLYRHFPTREDLIEAVYLQEVDRLHDGAAELLAEHEPVEALALWMDLFVQYAAAKRGLKGALQGMVASGERNPFANSRAKMRAALDSLLTAARDAGSIRDDVDAEDVLLATSGVWTLPAEPGWEERARKLLGLVMDGLRRDA